MRALDGMRAIAAAVLSLALFACRDPAPLAHVRVAEPLAPPGDGPALVALWGSWCPPCVAESEALLALAAARPGGLRVFVVPVDEPPDAARAVFGSITWAEPALAERLRVARLPAAFLARDGMAHARFDGPRAWADPAVQAALARLAAFDHPPAGR